MLVRIRLGTPAASGSMALGLAALLEPVAVSAFVLAFWRVGADMGWTNKFAIAAGILSHWQTWGAIGTGLQFMVFLLNRSGTAKPSDKPIVAGELERAKAAAAANSGV